MSQPPPNLATLPGDADLAPIRGYLLHLAEQHLADHSHAKGGASDLVQTALLSAHRARHQYRGRSEEQLRGWLRKILLNVIRQFRRRWRTEARAARREVSLDETIHSLEPFHRETPSHLARGDEQRQDLAVALAALPPEYREVIVWRTEDELSFAEIGTRLGKSEDAARMTFRRALERLRELLPREAADRRDVT